MKLLVLPIVALVFCGGCKVDVPFLYIDVPVPRVFLPGGYNNPPESPAVIYDDGVVIWYDQYHHRHEDRGGHEGHHYGK